MFQLDSLSIISNGHRIIAKLGLRKNNTNVHKYAYSLTELGATLLDPYPPFAAGPKPT